MLSLNAKNDIPKKKQIGLVIEPSLHRKVAVKCDKKGTTLSEIIRDLLDAWASGKIKITKNV